MYLGSRLDTLDSMTERPTYNDLSQSDFRYTDYSVVCK